MLIMGRFTYVQRGSWTTSRYPRLGGIVSSREPRWNSPNDASHRSPGKMRKTTCDKRGGPPKYASLAARTISRFRSHRTNLNGPVRWERNREIVLAANDA